MKKSTKGGEVEKTPVAEPAVELDQTSNTSVTGQTEPQGDVALNALEEMQLEQFENVIKQGLGSFRLVGKALKGIQDGKLYRAKYETFEDYCRKQWGLSDKYAYRLIEAYTVAVRLDGGLKTSPTGEIRLPTNESQVRPLGKLEPEKQVEAWQQVLMNCKDKPITAEEVEDVVNGMVGKPAKPANKSKTESTKASKKLEKIGKLVTEALEADGPEMTVPKLKEVLEKIQKLLGVNT